MRGVQIQTGEFKDLLFCNLFPHGSSLCLSTAIQPDKSRSQRIAVIVDCNGAIYLGVETDHLHFVRRDSAVRHNLMNDIYHRVDPVHSPCLFRPTGVGVGGFVGMTGFRHGFSRGINENTLQTLGSQIHADYIAHSMISFLIKISVVCIDGIPQRGDR